MVDVLNVSFLHRGPTCSEESMECASNPCLNGATCEEGFKQFVCECAPGYTGVQCETGILIALAVACVNSHPSEAWSVQATPA